MIKTFLRLSILHTVVVGFTILVPNNRPKTQLSASIGIFFGTSTGSTESAAELISAEFAGEATAPIDIDAVQGKLSAEFAKYNALIVGTPTWNTGADTERSGTGWDEVYYGEMEDLQLQGKKVAVFGLGDSVSYAENYADATGELHAVFQGLGCHMLGYTSQEGYEHEESKAALDDDRFCGLLLDSVNFEDLTPERISKWVAQLKEEGILQEAVNGEVSTVSFSPETVAPEPAVAVPAVSDDTAAIIAKLEQENAALRQQLALEESSKLLEQETVPASSNGFTPHYNAVTGRTMWTSADGKSCYYTSSTVKVAP